MHHTRFGYLVHVESNMAAGAQPVRVQAIHACAARLVG